MLLALCLAQPSSVMPHRAREKAAASNRSNVHGPCRAHRAPRLTCLLISATQGQFGGLEEDALLAAMQREVRESWKALWQVPWTPSKTPCNSPSKTPCNAASLGFLCIALRQRKR